MDEFENFEAKAFVGRLLGKGDWTGFMDKIKVFCSHSQLLQQPQCMSAGNTRKKSMLVCRAKTVRLFLQMLASVGAQGMHCYAHNAHVSIQLPHSRGMARGIIMGFDRTPSCMML